MRCVARRQAQATSWRLKSRRSRVTGYTRVVLNSWCVSNITRFVTLYTSDAHEKFADRTRWDFFPVSCRLGNRCLVVFIGLPIA